MRYKMSGTSKAWVGYHPTYGVQLYTYSGPHRLNLRDNGVAEVDGNAILHAGNYASVLNNSYVKKSGDTMTGKLTINTADYGEQLNIYRNSAVGNSVINFSNSQKLLGYLGFCGSSGTYPYDLYLRKNDADYKVWHSGNDGAGSGLDADLLDGLHETSFFRYRGDIPTVYVDITNYNSGATDYANYNPGIYNIVRNGYSELLINLARNGGSTSALQFKTSYGDATPLYFRKTVDANRVGGPWRTILTELNIGSYNAGSATKLQTTRYIYECAFDGTGNVNGVFHWRGTDATLRIYEIASGVNSTYGNETIGIQSCFDLQDPMTSSYVSSYGNRCLIALQPRGGRVAIGKTTADYLLDVNGDIQSNGWIRTKGTVGWYSQTYGGGWHMSDSTWIRNYNNKSLYMGTAVIRTDGQLQVGADGSKFKVDANGYVSASGDFKCTTQGCGIWFNRTDESNYIKSGSYDNGGIWWDDTDANSTTRSTNLEIYSHWGVAFKTSCPGLTNTGRITVGINTRSGEIQARGDIRSWEKLSVRFGELKYDDAAGAIYTDSGFYSTKFISTKGTADLSDMRLKRVIGSVDLSLEQIAEAPSILFEWRDGDGESIGTSAQYWEKILPWVVRRRSHEWYPNGGVRTLEYDKIALLSSVANSREILSLRSHHRRWLEKHETRLQRVERENRELRKEVEALKHKLEQYND